MSKLDRMWGEAKSTTITAGRLWENLVSLYSVQIINYLLPMIILPFLSRILGPAAWGQLAFAEAYAMYVSLVIEYGFSLSASREIAQAKADIVTRSHQVAGVLFAQILLAGAVILVSFVLLVEIPEFASYRSLLPVAFLLACFRSFMPVWYFQGMERLRVVAILNAVVNTVASAAILIFVRHPPDRWMPLAFRASAAFLACLGSLWLVRKETPFVSPTFLQAIDNLKSGFTLFLFRSAIGLYTSANVLILGSFVPAAAVAYFAGAEKIAHLSLTVFDPITLTLYPRIAALLKENPKEAMSTVRLSLWANMAGGVLAGCVILIFAPQLIHLLLGKGYDQSIPLLRAFSVMPPAISASIVLGVQWMLPLRLDWAYSKVILLAGAMNILLALVLVPRYQDMGMVVSVVLAEAIVSGGVIITLIRCRAEPWRAEFPHHLMNNSNLPQTEMTSAGEEAELATLSSNSDSAHPLPLVSIVVNNYNYASFLGFAIDSALRQTYQRIEVIVVDDGSTDNSRAVIDSYGDRVRAVYKTNGGQASAYNSGFASSQGDFVLYLDADDILDDDAIAECVRLCEPNVVGVRFYVRVVKGLDETPTGVVLPTSRLAEGDLREETLRYGHHMSPPSSANFYARAALAEILPVPEVEWRIGADTYCIFLTALLGQVRASTRAMGRYRIHGKNLDMGRSTNFRERLQKDVNLDGIFQRFCAQRSIPYVAGAVTNHVGHLKLRLASLLADPTQHLYPDDRPLALAWRTIRVACASPALGLTKKILIIGWVVSILGAPQKRRQKLVDVAFTPTGRSALINRTLSPARASSSRTPSQLSVK